MGKMTDLPPEERPRERLRRLGPEALTDDELLAIIFRTGVSGCNVRDLARNFREALGSRGLASLHTYNHDEFVAFVAQHRDTLKGIGDDKISTLLATIEFGRRVFAPEKKELAKPLLLASDMAQRFFGATTRHVREGFWALFLDHGRRLIKEDPDLITSGLRDQTLIDASALFRRAILLNASSVIVAHNHPSGDVTPSPRDIEATDALARAGRVIGIPLRDHIILGRPDIEPSYLSLRATGRCTF